MRGLLRSFVVMCIVLTSFSVALPAGASVAHTSGRLAAAPSGTCPGPAEPITPAATIMSSTTTPTSGETIEASGAHYCFNEDVNITLGGHHVTTTHTNGSGSFDPPVKVNYPAGTKVELCGIGATGLSNDQDCLLLTVSGGLGSSPETTHHKPSITGVEIAGLIVLALALLAGGVAFTVAGKRRSRHVAEANI